MTDGANMQFSKPEGEEGRRTLEHMNEHHSRLWDFCLSHMPKATDGSVLDIGCGGGGFIRRMSEKYPYAMFYGIDISEESVRMTSEVDADLISQGALKVSIGDVSSIPFADGSLDMVTAMETYFFWPDLEKGISEAHRVLSEGGVFVIGSEMQANPGDEGFIEETLRECGARLRYDSDITKMMETGDFSPVYRDKKLLDQRYYVSDHMLVLKHLDYQALDYVIIHFGVNDYMASAPLEGAHADDDASYAGSLRSSIKRIHRLCPNARIVISSIPYIWGYDKENDAYISGLEFDYGGGTIDRYFDVSKEVAEEFPYVYFLDNLTGCVETVAMEESPYHVDRIHYTVLGREQYTERLTKLLWELEQK